MKSGIIQTTAAQISGGGTITGDLIITGDLEVEGGGSLTVNAAVTGDTDIIDGTLSISKYSANTAGEFLRFRKSRSGTDGVHAVVQSGDILGEVQFYGSDGDSYEKGASIIATTTASKSS